VGHQKGACPCYGGVEDDPPGATRREAARAAMEYFEEHPPELFMEIRIPEQQLKDIARVVRRVLLGFLARPCAECGRKSKTHWTLLISFKAKTMAAIIAKDSGKVHMPLTPVCRSHLLAPAWENR
jgi:hypothetical protein